MGVGIRVESVWEAANMLTVPPHNEAEWRRSWVFWEETLTGAQGTRRASGRG